MEILIKVIVKKKGLTPEEKLKIMQMKELHKLVFPNIKDLTQKNLQN